MEWTVEDGIISMMNKDSYLVPLNIVRLEDGRFLGRSARLPGLNVEAETVEEVIRLAPRIARALIAAMRSKGVRVPKRARELSAPLRVQLLVSA